MPNRTDTDKIIMNALREDAYRSDITTRLFAAGTSSEASIIVKENAVLCGLDIAKKIFRKLDKRCRFTTKFKDGGRIKKNTGILKIKGKTMALLTAERVALNFLGLLSGVATQTYTYVGQLPNNKTRIYDTRKTMPGLRQLLKYAVRCGGGYNHRMDLSEMVLIKDNHRQLYKDSTALAKKISKAKRKTRKPIHVEVDSLAEFRSVLEAGADLILLDNMHPANIKKAVNIRNKTKMGKKPLLEASGGISLKNIKNVAQTGVDRIAIGAITHSFKNIDFTMELY